MNAHSDKNKMGIENISLIFSALLFEKENLGKSTTGEKEKGSHSWFKIGKGKHEKEKQTTGTIRNSEATRLIQCTAW